MTREEAIAYLEELDKSPDICYACDQGCLSVEDCKLRKVIEMLREARKE